MKSTLRKMKRRTLNRRRSQSRIVTQRERTRRQKGKKKRRRSSMRLSTLPSLMRRSLRFQFPQKLLMILTMTLNSVRRTLPLLQIKND